MSVRKETYRLMKKPLSHSMTRMSSIGRDNLGTYRILLTTRQTRQRHAPLMLPKLDQVLMTQDQMITDVDFRPTSMNQNVDFDPGEKNTL